MRSTSIRGAPGVAGLILLTFVLAGTPAWGGAAGPSVSFAGVWVNINTTTHFPGSTDGVPQLFASLEVASPAEVLQITNVTVQPPGGGPEIPLFKDTQDLFVETGYFRNLSELGVPLDTGTYTFRVTGPGGVTTVTDDLTSTTSLTPTAFITLSGAQPGSPVGDAFVLNLATNPTPTISWALVPGAVSQRVRVRPFTGPDVFSRTIDGTTTSQTLPAGVMVPGRWYNIVVDAEDANFLPNSNARARRTVRVFTVGPDIILSSTGGTGPGQTGTINARVVNPGPAITVNVVMTIGLPTGQIIPILTLNNVVLPANLDVTVPVFSRQFDGTEPDGNYVLSLHLMDPVSGQTVALQNRTFTVQ